MAPTLLPGDWLLADPEAYRARPPRVGELVLVPDPREPRRLLVKRVVGVDAAGLAAGGRRRPGGIDRLAHLRRPGPGRGRGPAVVPLLAAASRMGRVR